MGTKPVVEDFPRIYAKELIRRAKFDSTVTIQLTQLGVSHRHPHAGLLSVTLSPTGSYLKVRDTTWELVPTIISSLNGGCRWYFMDHTGKKVSYLLVDGDRVGSRLELRQRYRSQRCHNKKKARARLRKRYIDQLVDTPVTLQFCLDNPYFLPDKPTGRRMYWSKVRRIRKKLLAQIARERPKEELPWST
jgi:hypothetical protein